MWTQDPEFTFLTNRRNKISDMFLILNNNRQSYSEVLYICIIPSNFQSVFACVWSFDIDRSPVRRD